METESSLENFQTDPDFLKDEAYGNASGLETRTRIQAEYRTNPISWFRWLAEQVFRQQNPRLAERCRILELGCGTGDFWVDGTAYLPEGARVILSDFATIMAQETRLRLGEPFRYAVLDAQAIPFPDHEFDAVLGIGLIDHVPDRRRALDEVRRVLRPGGRFFVSAGGRSHLQEIESLVRPFLPEASYGGHPGRFGLENGEKILCPWFGRVERVCYTDDLVFDRAEPILAYVLSEAGVRQELSGEKLAAFTWYLKGKLAEAGEIRVTTDKGLFTAWPE